MIKLQNIKAVFVDIDNTLLDFNKSANESVRLAFNKFGLPFSDGVFPVFKLINDALWLDIEKGKLTKSQLHEVRFNKVLNALGIEFDGPTVEKEFLVNLKNCAIPVDGALDLVKYLSKKYILCTASNSFYEQQVKRLKTAGLYDYVHYMFISEKIGYEKPSRKFFDECFSRLSGISVRETVMVGDSLSADIKGGKDYGITTIWFNPEGKNIKGDYDYVVKTLNQLKDYL